MREHGRGHEGRVLDLDLVVDLVLLLETPEDGDGVLDRGLLDHDGLEAALEGGVLLDVLAVLVEGGGAHAAELAAGQGRLEHVRRVHRPFRRARPHQRVQLVDEADDLALALRDLAKDGLQAILELAAILRARDHGPDVDAEEPLALEAFGHVAGHDALGEALHDGRLAHPGLADEDRVVLRAPGKHLDDAADLLVAADDGIELALARQLRQVLGIALERLVLLLGIGIGHALGAAHLHEGLVDRLRGDAGLGEDAAGRARLVLGDADEEVLGGAVLVLQALGFFPGAVQGGLESLGGVLASAALHSGQLVELRLDLAGNDLRPRAQLGEERPDHAFLLLEQCQQEMLGHDGLVVALIRQGLRRLDGFLCLHGELVELHLFPSVRRFLSS